MAKNLGKKFEDVIRDSFLKYPNISVDRVNDNYSGYANVKGICDFIVYQKPYQVYVECKEHLGTSFPLSNIVGFKKDPKKKRKGKTQWDGLIEKSKIDGVTAGVILWLIDQDITIFLDIRDLVEAKALGYKSVGYHSKRTFSYPEQTRYSFTIPGVKKIKYYNYMMNEFFRKIGEYNDQN